MSHFIEGTKIFFYKTDIRPIHENAIRRVDFELKNKLIKTFGSKNNTKAAQW
jgi:hypothetical protein